MELNKVTICSTTIYETDNYDLFQRLEGNRSITEDRIKAISDSIDAIGYQPVPILVNEKFEVIDGQGRLEVCKRKGLKIYFVIKNGIGIEECRAMNIKMRNWTIYDFIDSFAEEGNNNYSMLKYYHIENSNLTLIEIAMCLSNSYSKNVEKPLRTGDFTIDDSEENLGCLSFINSAAEYLKEVRGGQQQYIPVLVGLYKFRLIDENRMLDSFDKHREKIPSAYNANDALDGLHEIYNKGRHKTEYFRDQYYICMQERGARYKS